MRARLTVSPTSANVSVRERGAVAGVRNLLDVSTARQPDAQQWADRVLVASGWQRSEEWIDTETGYVATVEQKERQYAAASAHEGCDVGAGLLLGSSWRYCHDHDVHLEDQPFL